MSNVTAQNDINQLKDWGLYLAGRQGEFDYLNSSDAAGNAVKIANQIKCDYQQDGSLVMS